MQHPFLGTFYRDSSRVQRFQTVITLLFEDAKAWFPYSRYRSLSVVDGLSRSLEYMGRWESLAVVGGLSGSLTVIYRR